MSKHPAVGEHVWLCLPEQNGGGFRVTAVIQCTTVLLRLAGRDGLYPYFAIGDIPAGWSDCYCTVYDPKPHKDTSGVSFKLDVPAYAFQQGEKAERLRMSEAVMAVRRGHEHNRKTAEEPSRLELNPAGCGLAIIKAIAAIDCCDQIRCEIEKSV